MKPRRHRCVNVEIRRPLQGTAGLVSSRQRHVAIGGPMGFGPGKHHLPRPGEALPGRDEPMEVPPAHAVSGAPLKPPFPAGTALALFGMGCFWGAERVFWLTPGVVSTAVGYAGGLTPNPTYREVCSGLTGHAEVVLVVFDPSRISYERLLRVFWENHDPTQGMRQGAGCRHAVPFGHLHLRRGAGPCGAGFTRRVPAAADRGRLRRDHHRNRRGAGLLLRRGIPPAIPGQEPGRLLWPRGHRHHASRRLLTFGFCTPNFEFPALPSALFG